METETIFNRIKRRLTDIGEIVATIQLLGKRSTSVRIDSHLKITFYVSKVTQIVIQQTARTLGYLKVPTMVFAMATFSMLLSSCGSTPSSSSASINATQNISLTTSHQERYDRAIDAITNGTPEKAIHLLEPLAEKYPRNLAIHINLAIAHFKNKAFDEALRYAQLALEIDPDAADAYNLLGLAATQKYAYKDAETAYLKALQLEPKHALVHFNIALMYDIYFHQLDKAIEHYQQYLAVVPEDQDTKLWVEQLKRTLSDG